MELNKTTIKRRRKKRRKKKSEELRLTSRDREPSLMGCAGWMIYISASSSAERDGERRDFSLIRRRRNGEEGIDKTNIIKNIYITKKIL